MAVSAEAKLDAHALREDFPIFRQEFHGKPLAYLDSAASSQKPRQMLEAMQHFYETSYANVHRGVYELAERATEGLETAREKIRAHLNAPAAREVIFVRNATEGINLVAYAWGLPTLGPGDLVLVTELEHHSNFVPWQYIAKRTGAEFRMIPLTDTGSSSSTGSTRSSATDALKVVALNLVSNALGTVNAVERIAAWAHERGAIVVCDAAQAAPHRALDVQEIGCDFVAISGHKMCGPSGIGAVWGRAHLLERMEPFLVGGHMIRKVQADGTTWGELPHKFEAGTAPMAEAVGFGAAVDYLNEVGLDAIARHEHDLTEYALGAARRHSRHPPLRPAARAPRGHRLLRVRRRPPARRGAGARLGGRRRPRRAPLLPAADGEARRRRDDARELLPLHDPRGDRPPRRGPPPRPEGLRLMDQLYREIILDHYKNPRGHGVMEDADASAEGQNPLCGDEVSIYVAFGEDGETIDEVKFSGRGCAISQAATSMLTEMVTGKKAADVAAMPKEQLLEELGIPLTPVRLKCALLGLTTLRLALHKGKGTPLPEGLDGIEELELS